MELLSLAYTHAVSVPYHENSLPFIYAQICRVIPNERIPIMYCCFFASPGEPAIKGYKRVLSNM